MTFSWIIHYIELYDLFNKLILIIPKIKKFWQFGLSIFLLFLVFYRKYLTMLFELLGKAEIFKAWQPWYFRIIPEVNSTDFKPSIVQ